MRRIPLIVGLVLIPGLIIHDIYEFLVTNEGVRYYSSEPKRLLYAFFWVWQVDWSPFGSAGCPLVVSGA